MTRGKAVEFRDVLEQQIPKDSGFYQRICRAYDILKQVRDESDGHGITFVLKRDDSRSGLDRYMENAQPYNGKPHNIDDQDITTVVAERREKDLATIIGSYGDITGANVPLPMDVVEYQDKYGISAPISQLLGYDSGEDAPGARTQSALCATDKIGRDIFIITLGETRPDGKKGPINAYYCGDRIYSSSGREMRWELANRRPDLPPADESNIISLKERMKHVPERECRCVTPLQASGMQL